MSEALAERAEPGAAAYFRRHFPGILRQEAARWGFVLRALTGAYLAMLLSMFLGLEQPSTAMLTALIVMQPQSGEVLAKSCHRMLGNAAGGLFVVLLFSACGGAAEIILLGMALWVGLCVFGSAYRRNAQSYGFVLAGYTACIIALPQLSNPDQILMPALLRVSEVFVGILCAAVTSEVVFPETVHRVLYSAAEGRFTLFDDFVRGTLADGMSLVDMEKAQQRFIRDVAVLDGYGFAASFEAGGALRLARVRLFNSSFMAAATSFHALHTFFRSLPTSPEHPARDFFVETFAVVAQSMEIRDPAAGSGQSALKRASALELCRHKTLEAAARFRQTAGADRMNTTELAAGVHLLCRFLNDMRDYVLRYADLTERHLGKTHERVGSTPGTDAGVALISALRAALVLLLLAMFWWETAWPVGSSAAIFAVVFCSLQAAAPNPVRSIFVSSVGCVLGVVFGVFYGFLVLPACSDLIQLCVTLFPFLAVGPYLMTIPATAGLGRSYNFMFASFAAMGLYVSLSPTDLMGGALAKLFGIAVAGAMLAVFFPAGGTWWKARLRNGLPRLCVRVCRRKTAGLLPRFESGVRDLVLQFSANALTAPEEETDMVRRAFAVGDLGRLILEIRLGLEQKVFPPAEAALLHDLPEALARLLEQPDQGRLRALPATLGSRLAKPLETADADGNLRADRPGGALSLLHLLERTLPRVTAALRLHGADAGEGGQGGRDAA